MCKCLVPKQAFVILASATYVAEVLERGYQCGGETANLIEFIILVEWARKFGVANSIYFDVKECVWWLCALIELSVPESKIWLYVTCM